MMVNNIVTENYNGRSKTVSIFYRDESGRKKEIEVDTPPPYFFVREDVDVPDDERIKRVEPEYRDTIYGEPVKKVVCGQPTDVSQLRDELDWTGEADVKFLRRTVHIDAGIKGAFKFQSGANPIRERYGTQVYNVSDLEPVDGVEFKDPKICYFDLEVVDDRIVGATYKTREGKYYTIIVDNARDPSPASAEQDDWRVERVVNEQELLRRSITYLKREDPDLLEAWYVDFDVGELKSRCDKYDNLNIWEVLNRIEVYDLLSGYKKLFRRGSNRLKDVVIHEGIAENVIAESFRPDFYHNNLRKFARYNRDDVKYIYKIDMKHEITEFFLHLRDYVGLESMQATNWNSVLLDVMLLRKVHDSYVLPSGEWAEKGGEKFEGATVIQPAPGIYENIGYYDFSKYYPNVVIAWNLSPEVGGKDDEDGVTVEMCKDLIAERQNFEDKLEQIADDVGVDSRVYEVMERKRNIVKFLLNSVWGFIGHKGCRIYKEDVAAEVTRHAREGIDVLKDTAEDMGYEVVYGDTDSILIETPDIESGSELEGRLNDDLHEWANSEGVQPRLEVELEKVYERIIFKKAKTSDRGAKKRYAGYVKWKEGHDADILEITGFEAIRRDAAPVTRHLQRKYFERVLEDDNPEGAQSIISDVYHDMKDGNVDIEDMAVRSTLRQPLEEYGDSYVYAKGSRYANKHLGLNIEEGDMVKMLYVRPMSIEPPTEVVCFFDEDELPEGVEVDIPRMIQRILRGKFENLLKLTGYRWASVAQKNRLTDVF